MANGWSGRRGFQRALTALAVACVILTSTARPSAEEEAGPDLDEVLGALRTLVGHPAWSVASSPAPPKASEKSPDKYQDARMFLAAVGERFGMVNGVIYLFTEPKHASGFVATKRATLDAQIKEMKGMGLPANTWTLGDGAGSANALEGFRFSSRLAMAPGLGMNHDQQIFSLGRVAVLLTVMNVPRLDRAAQDEAIDYAAAFLRDPVAARKRPKPVPLSFKGTGRVLRVRVEGPDGQPIPRASTVVRWPTGQGGARSFRTPVHEGIGTLPLPMPKKTAAQVFVIGAADADGEPLRLGPGGPIALDAGKNEIVVRLEPGLTIKGRVRTPAGEPAGGIRIEARLDDASAGPVPAGPRAPNPARVWSGIAPDPYTSARSSADGAFELVGLVKGPYRLRLFRGDDVASPNEPVVAAGSTNLEIGLRPTRAIRLTMLDPEGQPVPNATVRAHAEGRQTVRVQTDEKGVATLNGLDASVQYDLAVYGPVPKEDLLSIWRRGWKPKDETIRFEAGWRLRGVIQDGQGRPIRGWVHIRDGMGTQSDPDGGFDFPQLPKRPVQIAASALGFDTTPPDSAYRTVTPTKKPVVLTINEKWLTVRVTGPKGEPVPIAVLEIHLLDASGRILRSTTEEVRSGVWRGKHPNGPFAVEVYRAESEGRHGLGLAPARRDGLGPEDHDVALRLAPGGSVTGRVLDAEGKPVADLGLGALPAGLTPGSGESIEYRAYAWTRTDPDGTFALKGLGAGPYDLRLEVPESMKLMPVRVVAGARDVEVVLPAR